MTETLVDPAVSRAKFERELSDFRKIESDHRRKGVFVVAATFPIVEVLFAAPHVKPHPVLFAAKIDFTNYDLWPPSVRFIDPFTGELVRRSQLPPFLRIVPQEGQPGAMAPQSLVQAFQDEEPFVCMQGVREYHDNPAHTGDLWLLHRGSGLGTLFYLLDKLHAYGVSTLAGYQFQLVPQAQWGALE